tara:strand:- start:470 stop:577 length:108 start_codon:yes stop_codon:yes gene_type:complete
VVWVVEETGNGKSQKEIKEKLQSFWEDWIPSNKKS